MQKELRKILTGQSAFLRHKLLVSVIAVVTVEVLGASGLGE